MGNWALGLDGKAGLVRALGAMSVLAVGLMAAAPAPTVAGKVGAVLPNATIAPQQPTAAMLAKLPAAKKGDSVSYQQYVATSNSGRLRLDMEDGSVLNIGSSALVRVLPSNTGRHASALQLVYGKIREYGNGTHNGQQITTPTAVAGVIGTDVFLDASPFNSSITVLSGTVTVSSSNPGIGGGVTLTAGEHADVGANRAPLKRPATPQEVQQALQSTDPLALEFNVPDSLKPGAPPQSGYVQGKGVEQIDPAASSIEGAGMLLKLQPLQGQRLTFTLQALTQAVHGAHAVHFRTRSGENIDTSVLVSSLNPPTAQPGPALSVTQGAPATFNGAKSSSPNGAIASYDWLLRGVGQLSRGDTFVVNTGGIEPGTYDVQLTVVDAAGMTATAVTKLTITRATQAPVAKFQIPSKVMQGSLLMLDASASQARDGASLRSYSWSSPDFALSASGATVQVNTSNLYVGTTYNIRLEVTDSNGVVSSLTLPVVLSPAALPVAAPGQAQRVTAGTTATFDGSQSTASSGRITTYSWRLDPPPGQQFNGSPTVLVGDRPSFSIDTTALSPGDYTLTLVVTDAAGQTGTAATKLTVMPGASSSGTPQDVVQTLGNAYQALNSSQFLSHFSSGQSGYDPFPSYEALAENFKSSFSQLQSATVNIQIANVQTQGNYATVFANWTINYTFKANGATGSLKENLTIRLENVAGGGWLITDFQGSTGKVGTNSGGQLQLGKTPASAVANFTLSGFTAAAAVASGATATVSVTASNNGSGDAAASKIALTLQGVDAPVGTIPVPPLAHGASAALTGTFQAPATVSGANLTLVATINADRSVSESNFDDDTAKTTITVGLPDLSVSAVTAPNNVLLPGVPGTLTATVANGGLIASAPTTLVATLGAAAVQIGTGAVPNVNPGQSVQVTIPVNTPANLSGPQPIAVTVNPTHALAESSYANNTFTGTIIAGQPDLVVGTSSVIPNPLVAGTPGTLAVVVTNQGTAPSAATTLIATGDVSGTQNVPVINAGQSATVNISFTTPEEGTYNVNLAITADPNESNKTNNTGKASFQVGAPDYIVQSAGLLQNGSPVTQVHPGDSFNTTITLADIGQSDPAAAGTVAVHVAVSGPQGQVYSNDFNSALPTLTHPVTNVSAAVALGPNAVPGSYTATVTVNPGGAVHESSTANNTLQFSFTILKQADYVVQSANLTVGGSVASLLHLGDTPTLNFTVANQGQTDPPAGAKLTVAYAVAGPGKNLPSGTVSIAAPTLAQATPASVTFNPLGQDATPGTYTITVTANSDGALPDGNPGNNTFQFQITVAGVPDYVVQTANVAVNGSAVSLLHVGDSPVLNFTLADIGMSDPPAGSAVTVTFSVAGPGKNSPTGTQKVPAPTRTQTSTGSFPLGTLDSQATPGTYTITVTVNGDGALPDANPGNNTFQVQVTIAGAADYIVQSANASLNGSVTNVLHANDAPTLNFTLSNIGQVDPPAGTMIAVAYAVTGPGQNLPSGTTQVAAPTQAQPTGGSFAVPSIGPNPTPGTYTVTVTVNPDHAVPEGNFNNDSRQFQITVAGVADYTVPAAGLLVNGTLVSPATVASGTTVQIGFVVTNLGSGDPPRGAQILVSYTDSLNNKQTQTVFAPIHSQNSSGSFTLQIPATAAAGTVVTGTITVNSDGALPESNPANDSAPFTLNIATAAPFSVIGPGGTAPALVAATTFSNTENQTSVVVGYTASATTLENATLSIQNNSPLAISFDSSGNVISTTNPTQRILVDSSNGAPAGNYSFTVSGKTASGLNLVPVQVNVMVVDVTLAPVTTPVQVLRNDSNGVSFPLTFNGYFPCAVAFPGNLGGGLTGVFVFEPGIGAAGRQRPTARPELTSSAGVCTGFQPNAAVKLQAQAFDVNPVLQTATLQVSVAGLRSTKSFTLPVNVYDFLLTATPASQANHRLSLTIGTPTTITLALVPINTSQTLTANLTLTPTVLSADPSVVKLSSVPATISSGTPVTYQVTTTAVVGLQVRAQAVLGATTPSPFRFNDTYFSTTGANSDLALTSVTFQRDLNAAPAVIGEQTTATLNITNNGTAATPTRLINGNSIIGSVQIALGGRPLIAYYLINTLQPQQTAAVALPFFIPDFGLAGSQALSFTFTPIDGAVDLTTSDKILSQNISIVDWGVAINGGGPGSSAGNPLPVAQGATVNVPLLFTNSANTKLDPTVNPVVVSGSQPTTGLSVTVPAGTLNSTSVNVPVAVTAGVNDGLYVLNLDVAMNKGRVASSTSLGGGAELARSSLDTSGGFFGDTVRKAVVYLQVGATPGLKVSLTSSPSGTAANPIQVDGPQQIPLGITPTRQDGKTTGTVDLDVQGSSQFGTLQSGQVVADQNISAIPYGTVTTVQVGAAVDYSGNSAVPVGPASLTVVAHSPQGQAGRGRRESGAAASGGTPSNTLQVFFNVGDLNVAFSPSASGGYNFPVGGTQTISVTTSAVSGFKTVPLILSWELPAGVTIDQNDVTLSSVNATTTFKMSYIGPAGGGHSLLFLNVFVPFNASIANQSFYKFYVVPVTLGSSAAGLGGGGLSTAAAGGDGLRGRWARGVPRSLGSGRGIAAPTRTQPLRLTVQGHDITLHPANPRPGDPVRVRVPVMNDGDTIARDVPVELTLSGQPLASTTVTVRAHGMSVAELEWTIPIAQQAAFGERLRVQVDRDNRLTPASPAKSAAVDLQLGEDGGPAVRGRGPQQRQRGTLAFPAETCAGYRFAFAGETACGSADAEFMAAGGHVSVEGRDGIADLGFADLGNPPAVPSTGFVSTPQMLQVGHVYAVRVRSATVLVRVVSVHNPDAEREVREKVFGRGHNPLDHAPVPHTLQGGAPVTVTLEWLQ